MTTEANVAAPAAGTTATAPAAGLTAEQIAAAAAAKPALTIEAAKPATPVADPVAPKPLDLNVELVSYAPSGDAGLDVALEFIGNLGIGPEHAAMQAASNGDFAPLEAHLASLGAKAKGFEKMLALGKKAHADGAKADAESKAKAAADEKATTEKIHAVMGGAENWPSIQAWAASAATDQEKLDVAAAFKAGGTIAIAMAERLTNLYRKAGGTFKGKAAVKVDAAKTPGGPGADGPLSPVEYVKAVEAARRTHRGDWDSSKTYKDLKARRQAWRG